MLDKANMTEETFVDPTEYVKSLTPKTMKWDDITPPDGVSPHHRLLQTENGATANITLDSTTAHITFSLPKDSPKPTHQVIATFARGQKGPFSLESLTTWTAWIDNKPILCKPGDLLFPSNPRDTLASFLS